MTDLLKKETERIAELINTKLSEICDKYENNPLFTGEMKTVTDSVRYSLTAGGKRIRPFLVFCFCNLCGGKEEDAVPLACAIEMVHTYSLIHDDLPCMDNDDYRRGKPINHKVFGEATAVLAGDALLTEAFSVIVNSTLSDNSKVCAVRVLSEKAGLLGMIGGQEIDLSSEGKQISLETLYTLQRKKTGMLIEAACLLGCNSANVDDKNILRHASDFAHSFGLAFQITDDILDITGTTEELGKNVGSDEKENKCTFVSHLGLDGAKAEAKKHADRAIEILESAFGIGKEHILSELCDYLLKRKK